MSRALILEWATVLIDLSFKIPPEDFIVQWVWNLASKGRLTTMPMAGIGGKR